MSLLNVWLDHDRALVAVDTETSLPTKGGPVFRHSSKLFPIVHANTILAARGTLLVAQAAWVQFLEQPTDFDGMESAAVKLLNNGYAIVADNYRQNGWDLTTLCAQATLVGWSSKRARMCLHTYRRGHDASSFVEKLDRAYGISPSSVNPGDGLPGDGVQDASAPGTREKLEALARLQTTAWRKIGRPGDAIGGRLIIAELTRDTMTITRGCDLDAHASVATAGPERTSAAT